MVAVEPDRVLNHMPIPLGCGRCCGGCPMGVFSERAAPGDVNRYHQRTYDNGIFFDFSVFFLMLGVVICRYI